MRNRGLTLLWQAGSTKADKVEYSKLIRFYRVFGQHFKPYRGLLLLAYSSLGAMILCNLLVPWPIKLVIDNIVLKQPLPDALGFLTPWFTEKPLLSLGLLSLSIIGIGLMVALFSYLNKFYLSAVGDYMTADIRRRIFSHLQRLSISFHNSHRAGDIVYRIMSDTDDAKELLVVLPQQLIQRLLTIVSITGVMLFLNWHLALIAFSVVPLIYLFMRRFGVGVEKATKRQKKRESNLTSLVVENAKSIALIKAYGQEEAAINNFEEENRASLTHELNVISLEKTFSRVVDLLVATSTAVILYVGARIVLGSEVSPGTLVIFVAYLDELYGPIDKLTAIMINLAKNQVAGNRITELVDQKQAIQDVDNALPAHIFAGWVEFRNVTFAYDDEPVLKNISFKVEPGETIALVGHSGAGKSTLLNLLMRFYDPTEGQILIDGVDLRCLRVHELRAKITIVLQEAMLFSRSIYDNIAFGRPDATLDDVKRAARLAQADTFIEKLPDGYETQIKEGGSNLSGGQKQRINIARAIIRDTPLLILDEPTTGLDAVAEAKVTAATERLTEGKTTFIIAHKFSTIQNADKILFLEHGKLVDFGTHDELLERCPNYRKLYGIQVAASEQMLKCNNVQTSGVDGQVSSSSLQVAGRL